MAAINYSDNTSTSASASGEHRSQLVNSMGAQVWQCCNCANGWFNVNTDVACPACHVRRCSGCAYAAC
ncbi:transcription factor [Fusarium albosuccineum]|uniref:Transcription factor n=1 Tax=Fusarium albosuccineum TaxID=1237068 RepID=A0A8H4LJ41_9HYPO|nr:transcription factor [Fusarium albosuccineum]